MNKNVGATLAVALGAMRNTLLQLRRNFMPSTFYLTTFHINPMWVAADIIAIAFVILYPLVLAVKANRRLKVSWKYFAYGALIFFVYQLITRVPAVIVIQGAITPQLQASPVLLYTWLAILALTAG